MRRITASCTFTALLLAVAWADHHHGHDHGHGHDHIHPMSHGNHEEMACHKLSPHNADFGFALYKSLNAKAAAGKNIFYSPLGISSALAMLSKGSSGQTHDQLVSALGYSGLTSSEIDEGFVHLFSMLSPSERNQHLYLGNAAAVRSGFSPLKTYLNDVKDKYSGHIFNVNFNEPASAAAEINKYIASKTQDMIKDQVSGLDRETAMVLINYIFFRGRTHGMARVCR